MNVYDLQSCNILHWVKRGYMYLFSLFIDLKTIPAAPEILQLGGGGALKRERFK